MHTQCITLLLKSIITIGFLRIFEAILRISKCFMTEGLPFSLFALFVPATIEWEKRWIVWMHLLQILVWLMNTEIHLFFVTNGSEYSSPDAYTTNHCALLGGELSTPSTYDESLSLVLEYICSEARIGTNKGQSGALFTDQERDMVLDTEICLRGATVINLTLRCILSMFWTHTLSMMYRQSHEAVQSSSLPLVW